VFYRNVFHAESAFRSLSLTGVENPSAAPSCTVGILQPGYLPWLGFFDQLHRVDIFVHYDDVQFEKGSWRNRNRIKTPAGPQWLTVPVLMKGQNFPLIRDVRINKASRWGKKHVKSIEQNYRKAPYFEAYAPGLFAVIERGHEFVLDLNLELLSLLATWLGITTATVLASELGIGGNRTERLLGILTSLGATVFYEGASGRNYIDEAIFAQHGIKIIYQEYVHPVYTQLHGEFIPYLSIIDLVFNQGPASLEILLQGGKAF
jgi:hypothetical protein